MVSVMQNFLNVISGAIWKSPRWHLSIGIGIQVLSFAQYKLSLELKVTPTYFGQTHHSQ